VTQSLLRPGVLGEIDKAANIFQQWLNEEPGDPIARHMLAACTGRDVSFGVQFWL
jgi:hypothetical protein